MTARDLKPAAEIQPGQYIVDAGQLQLVTFTQHARGTVLLVYAGNWCECGRPERLVALATADEVFTAAAEAQASGKGLWNFPGLTRNVGPVAEVFGPMYADAFGPDHIGDDQELVMRPCARCGDPAVLNAAGQCTPCAVLVNVFDDKPPVEVSKALRFERDGWSAGDHHRPTPPPEAYQADRYDNGRTEACSTE